MEYSFGNWVRRRRKALDLTQRELARRVGCSLSLIFKIESDERRPSLQVAELLAQRLEIPPEQRALFLKIARQEKAVEHLGEAPVQSSLPPVVPAPTLQTQLPLPLTSFVGREPELHMIMRQIHDPTCRLLTLTGPGGVGKTRLTLEAARRVGEAFEFGVCFVSLVGTSAAEYIVPAIADSLGVTFSGTGDLKAQLFNFLKEKQILLVLDNLEHLLDGIEMLDELLSYAPGVKILTTSREQLDLRAEWTFEVQGLPIPADNAADTPESNSAMALFLQRARQARIDLTPRGEDLDAVRRICRLVEGLPLGLELAATWVRRISLCEVATEIERNVDFLTTTARDVPERHRSMRAVFDHSWSLLSPAERGALRQLSILRGGFTRQAAEQVAGANLAVLSALVDKSLVRRRNANRYELHGLVRQYADAMLAKEAGESEQALARYGNYYLSLLVDRDRELRSSSQKDALAELVEDIDNLRAAWEAASRQAQITLLREAAFPFWYFHNLRDSLGEGEAAFARAAEAAQARLEKLEAGERNPERREVENLLGELLSHQGQFTFRRGRIAEAAGLYRASLRLLSRQEAPAAFAHASTYCGVVNWIAGAFDQAWPFLRDGLSVCEEIDDEWLQSQCLTFMGMVALAQGDYAGAYADLSRSIVLGRAFGDPRLISLIAGQLSRAAQSLGRTDEVLEILKESLRLTTETGDRLGMGLALEQMAVAAQTGGDPPEARRLLKESIAQFQDIGDTWFLAHALNLEGYFALETGDDGQAGADFAQACAIAHANQAPPNVLDALAGLAILDMRAGQHEQALEKALQVLHHPASNREAKDRAEKVRLELEGQFEAQQILAIAQRARATSLDELVEELGRSG